MSCQQKDFLADHGGLQVSAPSNREPSPGPSSGAVPGGHSGCARARTPDPATEGLKPNYLLCSRSHPLSMEASQQTPAVGLQHTLLGIIPASRGQILPLGVILQ